MAVAQKQETGWILHAPEPVGEPCKLPDRLRARAAGWPVALGIDCPIGLPRAYAAAHLPDLADFPAFLRALAPDADFWRPAATLAEVSPARPFYPARSLAGITRLSHALALGLADAKAISRHCDRATAERPAGASLFWTLGPNQSGKAAISAWRELLIPCPALKLWPFAGPFRSLLAPNQVAVAETYPAEAMRHCGIVPRGSKRRQADRVAYAGPLLAAMRQQNVRPSPELCAAMAEGFGSDAAGEDRLDCIFGVLGVIGVVSGQRPDTAPDDRVIQRWEGWVLGQTALPA